MMSLEALTLRVSKADRAVELASLAVYESLDPNLQREVDSFLRWVPVGRAPRLESFDRALYEAYEPVRDVVRRRHGSKVTLYRGEPRNKPALVRKFLSWTPSWKLATYFAGNQDHEIIEAQVRTADVIAVFVSPNNRSYVEYLVRDRKEYHKQQSEEQVPLQGVIKDDSKGRRLGFPVQTELNGRLGYWDFYPDHARKEFPLIERAVRAVGGKVIGKYINEDDEGAGATVLVPASLGTIEENSHGDLEAQVGPYRVLMLRPVVGQSLRMVAYSTTRSRACLPSRGSR